MPRIENQSFVLDGQKYNIIEIGMSRVIHKSGNVMFNHLN